MMERPLRIGYVINSVEGGGAALPVPSIVSVLRRGGAEVKIFALAPRDRRALPALHAADLDVAVCAEAESSHFSALRWLNRATAEWQPTHLWTSLTRATLIGQIVGLLQQLPVVSWQHAAFLKPANHRLLRATARLSTLWIGDSPAITILTAERLGIEPARLMTWSIFRADPAAPLAYPRIQGPLRLGSLGRLHPVKGYDVLIDALALLGDAFNHFEVRVGGEGTLRGALEEKAVAAGLNGLRFVGYVDDPRAFLAECDLYVQPSRSEGLCIAAHEAMQAGLPVIASAVGELQHSICQGVTGHLVPQGDAHALARALRQVLSERQCLPAMGAAARTAVLARFGPAMFEAAGLGVLARLRSLT